MINSKDFFIALDLLEKEKKINKEFFVAALETALTSAYKKNFGEAKSATVKLNPEKNTIKVYAYKTVVEEVEDPDKEISLEEAKKLKSTYKVGDTVSEEVTPKSFGRIAAQTAKQVVMQKLREAERENISAEINAKGDQLTTAIVRRMDAKNVYLELSGIDVEGVLCEGDQIPGEQFAEGDRIKVYIKKVKETMFGSQIQVSRTTVGFVKKLFEIEIPEIENGEVVIKSIVREAGFRTKVAVAATVANIDPVGVCIGNRGARINSIVDELKGEKIDVIPWSEDVFEFIASALSPAEVVSVEINEDEKSSKVIVPDNKLSLAIGKEGMNVRLAARLTGWKIDVKSESAAAKSESQAQPKEVSFEGIEEAESDIFGELETID
ncbi:MAG: transcription termination/antitermination protein NusA [Clostridia bacterium]|nr:transcription termination/antitermination protein NusA [Clostridia bacterium]